MGIKVAFIGAGGVGFTRTLLTDILSVPELRDIQVSFTDISQKNLDMVTALCQRDIDSNGLDIRIHATTDRREALQGANYVINAVRVGGLDAFRLDIDIPLRYGVDQCVGDTLCAGGIMYGQRGVPVMLDFCRDIREVAAPGCRLLNYSNPNAMMTWAANKYGGVETIGLCHGVYHGHRQIAAALGLPHNEVDIVCAGINHQTWYIRIQHKGRDLTGDLLAAFERDPDLARTEKVRIDMLRRFGYYSTESNGHLSEYVPWYRKRLDGIGEWISLDRWINGETGGYLRVCTETRNWFETDFPNWMKEPPKKYDGTDRSTEHGSWIIEGLETGRVYRGHFNVMNRGCITNLPDECVVEVPGYVDGNGVSIPRVGDLPLGCAAVCSSSVWVQRLAVEAAVAGDDALLRQALMMDPLTGAVCTTPEIAQMADELLTAQAQWLPQYGTAIATAADRLERGRREGTLLPTREGFEGSNRLHVKTVEEMAADAARTRTLSGKTDKG
ncbi:MAG: alpha-glucosidase/alpha-galactosidase [Clostridia bacterium]|nr:alpha-glucosidase/alpha-galactosidase [Clostridia bacterium]